MTDLVFDLIVEWAQARNLIEGSTAKTQFVKLAEEFGELAADLARDRDPRDSIGDVLVVLSIIAEQSGTNIYECAQIAYNEIKDRKGRMVDGVFVKEGE